MSILAIILLVVILLSFVPYDGINAGTRSNIVSLIALIAVIWLILVLFGAVRVPGRAW